jgi:hypothetical protein
MNWNLEYLIFIKLALSLVLFSCLFGLVIMARKKNSAPGPLTGQEFQEHFDRAMGSSTPKRIHFAENASNE